MDRHRLAATLADAVRQRSPIAPLTDEVELSIEQAYDVQDLVLERLDPDGSRTAAKLGLTSRAKQEQMSVHEPIYGWYVAGSALDIGEPLDTGAWIQPRVEPEIAFLTSRRLAGRDVTSAHVLAATDAVMPALDVLDSRYAGYKFTLPDVVADDASAARYLLGRPVGLDGIDLATVGCVFEHNERLVATAAGAAVLDHPAAAVAWFVRKLADRGGQLPAGSIVLAGALTAAVPLEPGDVARITIDRMGTLELPCLPR
jgi:2-oxo-3-hexenedioate decarboxylase